MSITVPTFKHRPATKKRAQEICDWLWKHYEPVHEDIDDGWAGTLSTLVPEGIVRGDCEKWSLAYMGLLFHWGKFKLCDMAEVIVHTGQNPEQPYDHHVAAFWIRDRWHYCHNWVPKILTAKKLEKGKYIQANGVRATTIKFVQYRLLSEAKSYLGPPVHMGNP